MQHTTYNAVYFFCLGLNLVHFTSHASSLPFIMLKNRRELYKTYDIDYTRV